MRALSLFSGIGGIDLACEWAGIQTVAFCEIDSFCQKVLRKHWPHVPIYDDVRELTKARLDADGIGTIDLIHGGYPCQPFSVAGQRRGAEDDRHLWPEVARILSEIRPRWFVGENVAGHITLGLDDVLSDLESLGYISQAFVIPACAVGAPHRRDRVFIVAHAESYRNRRICFELEREERERGEQSRWTFVKRSSENVAYANGKRHDGSGRETSTFQNSDGEKDGLFVPNGENVADSGDKRRQERNAPTSGDGLGQYSRRFDSDGTSRPTQSGMGRVLDGLSYWLDGHQWPAGLGQQQYDWEPPRVATGVKNRTARLKALGNAVVPLQIFPIMAAIKLIDDWMRGEVVE